MLAIELTVEGDEGKDFRKHSPGPRPRTKSGVQGPRHAPARANSAQSQQRRGQVDIRLLPPTMPELSLVDTHNRNAHTTRQVVVSCIDRDMTHLPTRMNTKFCPHRHLLSRVAKSVDSQPSAIREAKHYCSIDHLVPYYSPNTLPNPWSASRCCRSWKTFPHISLVGLPPFSHAYYVK